MARGGGEEEGLWGRDDRVRVSSGTAGPQRWGGMASEGVPSPDSTSSLAQVQSPLLLLQVGSHFRLPEALKVIEASGQVPGHLGSPDPIGQLVSSLWPLAFLWGL